MSAHLPIDTALRPFAAIRAVRRLKANPEDTAQAFAIFRALRGKSVMKNFHRFAASPTGARVMGEKRRLLDRLSDRQALAALPAESFGRHYFVFMEKEQLTAEGLVLASQAWEKDSMSPEVQLFAERMRDAHDLNHVLTGYGRDGLGELCLLAFMFAHTRNLAAVLIVLMNLKRLPGAARRAVFEAWRNGRKAQWLQGQDYEALLPRPLSDVRHQLNIADPVRYRAVMP